MSSRGGHCLIARAPWNHPACAGLPVCPSAHVPRSGPGPGGLLVGLNLRDVAAKDEIDSPVDRHAQPFLEARQPPQIVAAPDQPGEEAGDLDRTNRAYAVVVSERCQLSERAIAKRLRRLSAYLRRN